MLAYGWQQRRLYAGHGNPVQLSEKHMQSYVDEMAWRFNNRDNPYLFRDTLLKLISADVLAYKNLIAN